MRIIDIINKKRQGLELTDLEISYIIEGYLNEEIKDYQMSALLMAICINSMSNDEISSLTKYMAKSGDILDLSSLKTSVVDKHSTGGVGDKTTLIVCSIAASLGCSIAKMSGRGLGHTGGTIDKLESIPNFKTKLTEKQFISQIKKEGFAITSQTGNLAPADKKIYALRDVSGTVESIPLIASSIMSKKIASGAKNLVIDLKVGTGALIKNLDDAKELARIMKDIGKKNDIKVICLLTNMDNPLGYNVGNSLEIKEVIDVLNNKGEKRLTEVCIEIATYMTLLGLNIKYDEAKKMVVESLESGRAYQKFLDVVKAQLGNLDNLPEAKYKTLVKTNQSGFLTEIDAYKLGNFCMKLGAGRKSKEEEIDYSVGIILQKNINDYVSSEDNLVEVHSNTNLKEEEIEELLSAFHFSSKKKELKMIFDIK